LFFYPCHTRVLKAKIEETTPSFSLSDFIESEKTRNEIMDILLLNSLKLPFTERVKYVQDNYPESESKK
jgi:hypothetical protein